MIQSPRVILECGICTDKLSLSPSEHKDRINKAKHGKLFCSLDCVAEHTRRLREERRARELQEATQAAIDEGISPPNVFRGIIPGIC
jgi:hypothetical protein